jgi:hypothetical protein
MAKFLVREMCNITSGEYALVGEVTLGTVNQGDVAVIKNGDKVIHLKIRERKVVANIMAGTPYLALIISEEARLRIAELNLLGKEIEVHESDNESSVWDDLSAGFSLLLD